MTNRTHNTKTFVSGVTTPLPESAQCDCKGVIDVLVDVINSIVENNPKGWECNFHSLKVTPTIREAIWERDREEKQRPTCLHSAQEIDEDSYHAAHLVPRKAGGTNEMDNLYACCESCNEHTASRHSLLHLVYEGKYEEVKIIVAHIAKHRLDTHLGFPDERKYKGRLVAPQKKWLLETFGPACLEESVLEGISPTNTNVPNILVKLAKNQHYALEKLRAGTQ